MNDGLDVLRGRIRAAYLVDRGDVFVSREEARALIKQAERANMLSRAIGQLFSRHWEIPDLTAEQSDAAAAFLGDAILGVRRFRRDDD